MPNHFIKIKIANIYLNNKLKCHNDNFLNFKSFFITCPIKIWNSCQNKKMSINYLKPRKKIKHLRINYSSSLAEVNKPDKKMYYFKMFKIQ